MHIPGLLGMPRRIYTYEPGRGWDTLNLIITIGAFIQAIAHSGVSGKPRHFLFQGSQGGQRPVGRVDTGMVHQFAAA